MSAGKVIGTQSDGVAHLVFSNGARRNALTLAMSDQASSLIEAFATDPQVHLLVVSGASLGADCMGSS